MGTNFASLVVDMFLFSYERDFMLSLSDNNQADVVKAFNSTSRYLDDLYIYIDNSYFEQMVSQIYPTELQLNKANSFDTEAPFLDSDLSTANGIISSKIYDKRDNFNFEIVKFSLRDGDVPRHLPMVYTFRNLFVLRGYSKTCLKRPLKKKTKIGFKTCRSNVLLNAPRRAFCNTFDLH